MQRSDNNSQAVQQARVRQLVLGQEVKNGNFCRTLIDRQTGQKSVAATHVRGLAPKPDRPHKLVPVSEVVQKDGKQRAVKSASQSQKVREAKQRQQAVRTKLTSAGYKWLSKTVQFKQQPAPVMLSIEGLLKLLVPGFGLLRDNELLPQRG
jgi:hypothetical protein